jgi:hypothetical protein
MAARSAFATSRRFHRRPGDRRLDDGRRAWATGIMDFRVSSVRWGEVAHPSSVSPGTLPASGAETRGPDCIGVFPGAVRLSVYGWHVRHRQRRATDRPILREIGVKSPFLHPLEVRTIREGTTLTNEMSAGNLGHGLRAHAIQVGSQAAAGIQVLRHVLDVRVLCWRPHRGSARRSGSSPCLRPPPHENPRRIPPLPVGSQSINSRQPLVLASSSGSRGHSITLIRPGWARPGCRIYHWRRAGRSP